MKTKISLDEIPLQLKKELQIPISSTTSTNMSRLQLQIPSVTFGTALHALIFYAATIAKEIFAEFEIDKSDIEALSRPFKIAKISIKKIFKKSV